MKKIGTYTARGIVTEAETDAGEPQKIPLFDGKFTTGYRVTRFQVWGSTIVGSGGFVAGKLSKNEFGVTSNVDFFRADDDNQIAWSQSAGATDGGAHTMGDFIIDRDNMIVEDIYVYGRANVAGDEVNYLIEMDKYEISDWKGALTMARDKAQE
jgi:hypothetical protein